MGKRNFLYVFVLMFLTSCLDQEESNYHLKYENYKVEGVFIKDCEGEPLSGVTLRLYTVTDRGETRRILGQTSTSAEGLFSMRYDVESTTFRFYSNDLLIYSYDELSKVEKLVSIKLPWQKDLFVDLIQNIEDTIYFYTTGLNQLTNSDTLFLKEPGYSNVEYSKYFTGPFPEGRLLDSIRQPFTNYKKNYFEWYISDTCKTTRSDVSQMKCNPGNYGILEEIIPYCERLNFKIDLSNAIN